MAKELRLLYTGRLATATAEANGDPNKQTKLLS